MQGWVVGSSQKLLEMLMLWSFQIDPDEAYLRQPFAPGSHIPSTLRVLYISEISQNAIGLVYDHMYKNICTDIH